MRVTTIWLIVASLVNPFRALSYSLSLGMIIPIIFFITVLSRGKFIGSNFINTVILFAATSLSLLVFIVLLTTRLENINNFRRKLKLGFFLSRLLACVLLWYAILCRIFSIPFIRIAVGIILVHRWWVGKVFFSLFYPKNKQKSNYFLISSFPLSFMLRKYKYIFFCKK